MSIVSEKKFLTEGELAVLKEIQSNTSTLIFELGEIELVKLQVENRYNNAKQLLNDLSTKEKEFTNSIYTKYGKVNINPENGEIMPMN
jgi:hypothetical protein